MVIVNNIIQQKGAGTPYAFWAHHKPQHNMDHLRLSSKCQSCCNARKLRGGDSEGY